MSEAEGQIVTFYSYKGGTGRSMMLANVAWILASNGQRVLTVDWDLEAPGLHRYFQPFLLDEDLLGSDGIIDFVSDFTTAARGAHGEGEDDDWFDPYADLAQYAVPLDWDFDGGRLDHVGAGRQGASYSLRVSSFDWAEFYDDFGGGAFLSRTREHLKRDYDYVLIDSRTGLADTSGICTVQMPDALVVCFTLNNQSVNGAADVAESVRRQRGENMRMLTVPMRVDNSEKIKLELRREAALERFAGSADAPALLERQWAEVEVGYQPFYAYEEILATFGDVPGRGHTILAAAESMAAWVTNDQVTKARRVSESRRREVLARYEGTLVPPRSDSGQGVYISYRRSDAAYAGRLYDALAHQLGPSRVVMDIAFDAGVDFIEHIEGIIEAAAVVIVMIGPHWLEDQAELNRLADPADPGTITELEIKTALAAETRVIPVFVGGATPRELSQLDGVSEGLARRQAVELSDSRWRFDVRRLTAAVELAIVGGGQPANTGEVSQKTFKTSPESREVIDEVLGQRRLYTIVAAVSVIVAVISLVLVVLTFVKL
jgi:Mrp family chromosome partitioning ATPase